MDQTTFSQLIVNEICDNLEGTKIGLTNTIQGTARSAISSKFILNFSCMLKLLKEARFTGQVWTPTQQRKFCGLHINELANISLSNRPASVKSRTSTRLVVEEYAQAFVRYVPRSTKVLIVMLHDNFALRYSMLEGERLLVPLRHMRDLVVRVDDLDELGEVFVREFEDTIRKVVADMDTPRLAIGAARNALLEHDDASDADPGYDIDFDIRKYEKID